MSPRSAGFGFALGLALAWCPAPARTTTMVHRSVGELARMASTVVLGVPHEAHAFWDHGRIFTDMDIEVLGVVRGAEVPGGHLVLRTPGGVVAGVGQQVAGGPVLDGERTYVLFLGETSAGIRATVNLAAGVLPVTTLANGELRVLPARTGGIGWLRGAATAAPGPNALTDVDVGVEVPAEGMVLATFIARVRALPR